MTCIAGFIHNGRAYVGADACISRGDVETIRRGVKLCRKGEFVIGCAGLTRVEQLVRHSLTLPERAPDEAIDDYMVNRFAVALREMCRTHNVGTYDDGTIEIEARFLVAWRDHLFEMGGNFSVLKVDDQIAAVGNGADPALGALYATRHFNLDPIERLTDALLIAEHTRSGVRRPFTILST